MVYQPQQPQYGVPQQQYGAPPMQYGQPPTNVGQQMPPAEIKWSGLETGGAFKVPVVAFIGRLTEVKKDASSQYGLRIIEKFDQVQILESPVPWPWATVDLSIKYSSKENSGWGHHVASAKALGIATTAPTLDAAMAELTGKIYEMRQSSQSYGEDNAGQAMHGDVWRLVRIVQPGMAQSFPQPQYAQPAPQPVATQYQPQPTTAQSVVPQSQPAGVVAPAPNQSAQGGLNLAIAPTDTPSIRAKKLLHNRALNEWLGAALMDDLVKNDSSLINSIYDQSFIVGLKASGQVSQGTDGKFQVVA